MEMEHTLASIRSKMEPKRLKCDKVGIKAHTYTRLYFDRWLSLSGDHKFLKFWLYLKGEDSKGSRHGFPRGAVGECGANFVWIHHHVGAGNSGNAYNCTHRHYRHIPAIIDYK